MITRALDTAYMTVLQQACRLKLPQAALTLRSAARFSNCLNNRFKYAAEITDAELLPLLSKIRSSNSWVSVWNKAAAAYETKGTRLLRSGENGAAARDLLRAALFYHYAQTFGSPDSPSKNENKVKTQSLYRLAAPHFSPPEERVEIPFRNTALPGYLRMPPPQIKSLKGTIIFPNSTNTVKEEFHHLSTVFGLAGYATLAFDDPGTGEAWPRIKGLLKQEQVAAAILKYLGPRDLPARTIVFGLSLGGLKAFRMAAFEKRISAVVAVTPPFNGEPYYHLLNPLVRNEISHYFGGIPYERQKELTASASLAKVAGKVKVPVFVAGALLDTVLPPAEAWRTYSALPRSPRNRFEMYRSGHTCMERFDMLVNDVLNWLKTS
jgi:pimeloyl-ACP methyl ester carboxylesterase